MTPPHPDIQTFKASNCPTTRTVVRDARDDATYWIRKIGSLCWMETNLAYAGGGDNTYGDVIASGTTTDTLNVIPDITIPRDGVCWSDVTRPCVRTATPGANRTSGSTNPSISTDGGITNPQYGYLYSWCAAMGIQSTACQSGITQPNQSVNPGNGTIYNICPAGWRLPTSGSSGGEFATLNAALNNGSTTDSSGLLANGLLMLGGSTFPTTDNSTFHYQGQTGYYWSSTVYTANGNTGYAYAPYFYKSGTVNISYANWRRDTYAVRCVAP